MTWTWLLPGLIAFQGMVIGLNSVAFQLARDKNRGTLRRIRATPIPTLSFVGGVIASRLVIATAATLITYVTGVFIFGADMRGNPAVIIFLGVLGAAVFIAIGIFIVSMARSDEDVPPLTFLPLMISVLFSGAFLDRSGLPDWLHWVTGLLPLTFVTNAVQDIATLGASLADISGDLLGLLVWGVAVTILAAWRFRMA
ncbi:MAG: ABC transporter permease [Dehalococcoidia bacterium]|nr:ABC transporter permease [Dehalococcoidia bacterium]